MGYYTEHTLEILGGHYDILEEIVENDPDTFYGIDTNEEPLDSVKWYSHQEDMRKISKQYPDLVFKLSGNGEESGDMWIEYYKNGLMQNCHAKITFDEYDESKLK
ncbi:hypothetical protein [Metabacillus fastidiosus]|uniref:hypothetical protein n=1 Tax=Metabacillus fastidiosus TaxID=1458 RepID=UPI003D293758